MGKENVKNIQKTNIVCYRLRWEFKNLRKGGIFPPTGPEKKEKKKEKNTGLVKFG